jgi:D-beta-D-heptose 7-phosphate kinase/D-beta-D-heptose 1-phosphate adenosyltransferase
MDKVVLVTGGFDPIHSGHIKYFEEAKLLADGGLLIVGLNSDNWLSRKKGKPFMPWSERSKIVEAIKPVGLVLQFNDDDDSSKLAIKATRLMWPTTKIIFANGGDRVEGNNLEIDYVKENQDENVEFVFGVGGSNKMNSSSWILEKWKSNE